MARDLIKSDLTIKASQPKTKPYRLNDGNGLILLINPNGSKYWRLNYSFYSKRKTISLGTYPEVSLKKARLNAQKCQDKLSEGTDPSQARKASKQAKKRVIENEERLAAGIPLENSFTEVSQRWLKDFEHTVTAATFSKITRRIEQHILPTLGNKPIADIKAPDVLKIVQPIAKRKMLETAHRVLTDCKRIFKYAIAHGLIEYDPSYAIGDAIAPVKVQNRATIIEPRQIGQLARDIDNYTGTFIVQCALKLSLLTFARPGEIRQMQWQGINFDSKEWRYFVTKTETEQLVPLSTQVIDVLESIQSLTGAGQYVFPGARSDKRPMSNNAVRLALRTMGYDAETMSAHGFRSTASTILNEQGWNSDFIEKQLAHTPKNKVRAAYNRAQYIPERQKMMQFWANHLDALKDGANIIPIKKKRL